MAKVVVIGGTGFAGQAIVKEAARRGHEVVSVSRSEPKEQLQNVRYVQGSVVDVDFRLQAIDGADIVVGALSPRGDMAGKVRGVYTDLVNETTDRGARFVMVGGFSSLRPRAGSQRFFEDGSVPAEYLDEAVEMAGTFDSLKADSPKNSQWVYVSPARLFGAQEQIEDTGGYQLSGDVAILDDQGMSVISAGDFARGILDEIEAPAHNHENISFAQ